MIAYHGTPITPEADAVRILRGRHGLISFAHPEQIATVALICSTFVLDNGAFTAWKVGKPISNWNPYYAWVEGWWRHPGFDFALIPDDISGNEEANDRLLAEWPFDKWIGTPVWHMHEGTKRLARLVAEWPRVAIGSSGSFASVGTKLWWSRIAEAMNAACDAEGRPLAKLHGLRMLDTRVFSQLPLSSADSTNVARNIGIDRAWKGTYQPANKAARGVVIADRIESETSSPVWSGTYEPLEPTPDLVSVPAFQTASLFLQ